MSGLALVIEELGEGSVQLALRGELDLASAYTFDATLRQVERDAPACIVLDLRELRFMDSAGLSRLLAARRRARRAGCRLVLVRGPTAVQRLLAIAALDEVFEIVGDPDAALPV